LGPHINAFTSHDETSYQLSLPIDPAAISLGFEVLADWASEVTFDPADVDAERGVVIEEWRSRLGGDGRVVEAYHDAILAGSSYAKRSPIGSLETIERLTAEQLRSFYQQWYRPDLMALVVVGDIDVDDTVTEIRDRFSSLAGDDPLPRPRPEAVPWPEPLAVTVSDGEISNPSVVMFAADEPRRGATRDEWRSDWIRFVALDAIANRLADDVALGVLEATSAGALLDEPVRALAVPQTFLTLGADTPVAAAVAKLATEVERAARHGFAPSEVDRVLSSMRSAIRARLEGASTTQDHERADRYVEHFLTGVAYTDDETEHDIDLAILDGITVDEVSGAFAEMFGTESVGLMLSTRSSDGVPTPGDLLEILAATRAAELEPRPDLDPSDLSLPEPPAAIEPTSVYDLSFEGATAAGYPNGARVGLLESSIEAGQVRIEARSYGGLSVLADADVVAGRVAAEVAARSGVAHLNQVELDLVLADHRVSVDLFVDDITEGLVATAASEDLEVMLALVRAYLTQPRATDAAVSSVLAQHRLLAAEVASLPNHAPWDALFSARYGDEPRYRYVSELGALDAVDSETVQRVLDDRFGNATGWTFAIVGDMDTTEAASLSNRYLGTLPGDGTEDVWVDHQDDPPPRHVRRTVRAGSDPKGSVTIATVVPLPPIADALLEQQVDLLELVLDGRLRQIVREDLSATYGALISIETADEPDPIAETLIVVESEPDRLTEIEVAIRDQLTRLGRDGPLGAEFQRARAQYLESLQFWDNLFLADALLQMLEDQSFGPDRVYDRRQRAASILPGDVRDLAAHLYPVDRSITVLLRPAT
jgi:zinc protease